MTTRSPDPHTATDTDAGADSDREITTGAPRWVKVFGIVVLGLAVLLVGLKLTGIGPDHGPGRHGSGGGKPPAGITENGAPMPGMQNG